MASPLQDLKIVGQAKLRVLFWDIYHSTLYSASGRYEPNEYPQVLEINYLRNITAQDLLEKTADEWQKLNIAQQDIDQWLPLLTQILPDIKKGDTLLLQVEGDQQSEFFFNGLSIGNISNPDFGPSFLRIWLDENCSYPKVRNQLIGLVQ